MQNKIPKSFILSTKKELSAFRGKILSILGKNLEISQREAASQSSFCPLAPVESFLVAKVSIGERLCFETVTSIRWSRDCCLLTAGLEAALTSCACASEQLLVPVRDPALLTRLGRAAP